MRVTDEMVEAARDAVRQVTGGAFTPSGLLTRTALEAALAAAPQAAPVAWAQKEALEGVHECGEITCTLYAEGYQPEQEWTEPLYTAPQPEAVTYTVDGMSVCLTDCVNTSEPPTAPDDKLRKAARQVTALWDATVGADEPARFNNAITALRAALEGKE